MRRALAALAAVVALGLTGCGGSGTPPAAEPTASPAVVQSAPPSEPTAPEPAGEPSPDEGAPAIDAIIQAEAVTIAREYLDLMGFSRDFLIKQLAHEGVPDDIAATAVDSLDVDWNEQAVRSATQHLEGEQMTRGELVQVLTSEYGQYTIEQAEYAANAVG